MSYEDRISGFGALAERSCHLPCQPRPVVPRNPGVVLPVVAPSINPSVPELEGHNDLWRPAVLQGKEFCENVVIPLCDVVESFALMCVGISEKSPRENLFRGVRLHRDSVPQASAPDE